MNTSQTVYIAGIGTTSFGRHTDRSMQSLVEEAWGAAREDSGLTGADVSSVFFGNAAQGVLWGQEMIRGQVALKGTDLAGKPVVNVENACASGSSAAFLAYSAVASGAVETAVAVGAEKLLHPDKARSFAAIESGTDLSLALEGPESSGSVMMAAYAAEADKYARKFVPVDEALAEIAVKNRRHAAANPAAQYRELISREEVLNGRMVAAPLRMLMCSPLTDGAAAIVFSSKAPGAQPDVRVSGMAMAGHRPGGTVVAEATVRALAAAGIGVGECDVLQMHDACAFAELKQMEDIGLVGPGEAVSAVLAGETAVGGGFPINTDGGLLSRGHALGATGLAQLIELTRQLRGEATGRQVDGARTALAANSGGWMGDDYAAAVSTVLQI